MVNLQVMDWQTIQKPTLIVDKNRLLRNVDTMVKKANVSGCRLKPHVKSHQSKEIAEWLKERGITGITVSSVDMAEYFTQNEWSDITIAFPVNIHQITRINELAAKIDLHITVENIETGRFLKKNVKNDLNLWIEIDVGYRRTGIPYQNTQEILDLAREVSKNKKIKLSGILTHAGHTYGRGTRERIIKIYNESVNGMKQARTKLRKAGFKNILISTGDTPSCSVIDKFDDSIDEIRPGNFVFYDLAQVSYGSTTEENIAIGVACPVISKRPERGEFTIYGGGVHLCKDYLTLPDGRKHYGKVALFNEDHTARTGTLTEVYVSHISQEHGKISAPEKMINSLKIGDPVIVIPIHACMTANSHKYYYTYEGEKLESFTLE